MATLVRVRSLQTGVAGSPYYTNHYFTFLEGQADAIRDRVKAFWDELTTSRESQVQGIVEAEQTIIDDTTGQPTGTQFASADVVIGGSVTTDPLPYFVQGLVQWTTDTYINGRRLRGHTFIPGVCESLSVDGRPTSDMVGNMNSAAAALLAGGETSGPLRVLSRTHSTSAIVGGASASSYWSSLRSRRQLS